MNATIEAARAGDVGRGFGVVANEVKDISQRVTIITEELEKMFLDLAFDLERTAQTARGDRFADLARYAVELMDRNLYERSCDVRWWATDAAVVDVCEHAHDDAIAARASERLGVILDSYTVYLDLWVADRDGNIIANGRPNEYRLKGVISQIRNGFRMRCVVATAGNMRSPTWRATVNSGTPQPRPMRRLYASMVRHMARLLVLWVCSLIGKVRHP